MEVNVKKHFLLCYTLIKQTVEKAAEVNKKKRRDGNYQKLIYTALLISANQNSSLVSNIAYNQNQNNF